MKTVMVNLAGEFVKDVYSTTQSPITKTKNKPPQIQELNGRGLWLGLARSLTSTRAELMAQWVCCLTVNL